MKDRLIALRNRLSNDGSGEIFEEDYLLLDEVLDFIEKIEQLDQEHQHNVLNDFYNEVRAKKVEELLELYRRFMFGNEDAYTDYEIIREIKSIEEELK